MNAPPLRVVFCWAEVSGYAAACWRAMSRRRGIDLHVVHVDRVGSAPNPFDANGLLDGISNEMLDTTRPDLEQTMLRAVADRDPDVVVLCGWVYWPYTRLIHAAPLQRARKLLGMDTPWRGTLLQRLARYRLGHFIRDIDLVVVAGERSAEYARRIGVPQARLRTGFYGFDYCAFAAAAARRPVEWPRQFLYAGRYAAEKDLPTLLAAYRHYRSTVNDPWGLTCRGTGPARRLLENVDGVVDGGFAQPSALPEIFANHGAFVLPSRFEPWGVVIAEAAAAGLPIVCSMECGAAADMVRPYYNGIVVPPADSVALAKAMQWVHEHAGKLPAMGARGQALAQSYSAEAWAQRWHEYMLEAIGGAPPCAA
jgi:glycosyltransferase involved in cell wall biosynthesis